MGPMGRPTPPQIAQPGTHSRSSSSAPGTVAAFRPSVLVFFTAGESSAFLSALVLGVGVALAAGPGSASGMGPHIGTRSFKSNSRRRSHATKTTWRRTNLQARGRHVCARALVRRDSLAGFQCPVPCQTSRCPGAPSHD